MNPQIKDHFYDQFLKEPTKDNFRDFMKKSCGELNEMDFKETWIDKGPLAKIMLAMANNGGGIIIFGVKENEDNTFDVLGLDNLKDTADISNSISRLVSSSLDYEVFNFVFDSDVYGEFENKKFQIMVIHDTPERLPFVSLGQSEKIEKDVIYVRRGTKSEKATSEEINRIIERKIATIYSENTDMSLDQHLEQLKKLYSELPQKIRVLVRKGSQPNFAAALKVFGERIGALYGTPDEYEAWVNGVTKECTVLEIEILKDLVSRTKKKIFVDTNISVEILHEISDENHVLIMLADPNISVQRFFERPDKEKQFLYQLLLKEDNPEDAMINFRECLKRVNSQERYMMFQKSGFNVITRDENRSIDETFALAESMFGLNR